MVVPKHQQICASNSQNLPTELVSLDQRITGVFNLHDHESVDKHAVQQFIQNCFNQAYGAQISHFMPRLFSLQSKPQEIIAAFGLRPAVDNPLFLEKYLNIPIEQHLQTHLNINVLREHVVEVGNLSAVYPGAARSMIIAVTAYLYAQGYKWVVFTGTTELRNGFSRLGLRPITLGKASLEKLPLTERSAWGSYYDHMPMVMAGDIHHGYELLLNSGIVDRLLKPNIVNLTQSDPV
jgi:hypothetical protein